MRKLGLIVLLCLATTVAFAGEKCGGKCGSKCSTLKPDWGYTYQDPHYLPDCAPRSLVVFHERLIPMLEARKSGESAYLRENSERLYFCAKELPKAEPCCMEMKAKIKLYKRAAKDLVKSCDRLRDISFGGTNDAVYEQMKLVEEGYVRVANLCE